MVHGDLKMVGKLTHFSHIIPFLIQIKLLTGVFSSNSIAKGDDSAADVKHTQNHPKNGYNTRRNLS